MRRTAWAIATCLCLLAAPAWAGATIVVTGAWTRVTVGATMPAIIYLTVTDHDGPDQLIAVSSPAAKRASLHRNHMVNGVMVMDPVATLPVSADQPLWLAPGGYHVMLEGLAHPLVANTHVTLTLTFAKAGPVTVSVEVKSMSYMPPGCPSGVDDAGSMPDDTM
jgi:periplasmic copper chaperone A